MCWGMCDVKGMTDDQYLVIFKSVAVGDSETGSLPEAFVWGFFETLCSGW